MATEIHRVSPPSSASDTSKASGEEKDDKANANVSDIEGNDVDEESKKLAPDRAEATELTPMEAFKWNVDGDQSPCACQTPLESRHLKKLYSD